MESGGPQVLLFGDQVVDKLPTIRSLYSIASRRPQLKRFLEEATSAVQVQLPTLSLEERQKFGTFSDLLELAERYSAQEHPDEICGATLITASQIGEYLCLAEDNPSILSTTSRPQTYQLGFCVGLLAASVASAARDTSEILAQGVEAVAISFRLGRELNRRARLVQDTDKSWGLTIVGAGPEDIAQRVEAFNSSGAILSSAQRAYVGIRTGSWSTVFGPPATLDLLDRAPGFGDVGKSPLVAAIAVHASHLVPIDMQVVVGDAAVLASKVPAKTCVSSSLCQFFEAATLRELMLLAVEEVAQRPLLMEQSVCELGAHIVATKAADAAVTLTTVGPTPHTAMVKNMLAKSQVQVQLAPAVKPADGAAADDDKGSSGLVAIVGMSGRFPQSDSLDEFWEMLRAGTDTHEEIPLSRFPIDEFYDPAEEQRNSAKTRFGCFLKNPGLFDNRLFNISPREAMQMDPLQRMLLMTTYEALEMAGYSETGAVPSSRIATYFGQTTEDWRTINDQQGCDTHYLPGSNRAFAPGRVNHYFRWGGGYYSIDTACSSSSTSIYLACNALLGNECDMSVVGGGSLLMLPELYSGLSRGGFLSATGGCKAFSDDADGYCRGEAVGVVVLKRLEDALRHNDNILAVVRGVARNSNAGAGSITYPGQDAQAALFNKLLRGSGVDAREVSFIEMHGTGTQVGDEVEMSTVCSVFAQSRSRDNPLHVGALKANIGHSEAAAGVVSVIKSVLMLQRGGIPPQPNLPFELNHKYPDLDAAHIKIADGSGDLVPWAKGDGKRKIVINGFDAAGGNTSILIEDGPERKRQANKADPRSHHVVVCSARTPASLAANREQLLDFLTANPGVDLADVGYTTTARRIQEVCRQSFVAGSVQDLVQQLERSADTAVTPAKEPSTPPVFLFTGQSSQYTGMGGGLYKTSPRFRQLIDSYEALCLHNGLESFVGLIRGDFDVDKASPAQLQLAVVALEIALARFWISLGLQPGLVAGHSLGEYAALCVAGVLSVSDTLCLVHQRARLMQERCSPDGEGRYGMLAIPLAAESKQMADLLRGSKSCQVACVNSPSSTVVSGLASELEGLQAELKANKTGATMLQVPFGFHSSQMDPIIDDFKAAAAGVHFGKPTIPVVSTMTGAIEESFDAAYLAKQIRSPVQFLSAMQRCEEEGLIKDGSVVVEIGPHPVCIGLATSCLSDLELTTIASLRRSQDDWMSISACLAAAHQNKLPINWTELHSDYLDSLRLLEPPSYAFDLKNYWVSYQPQVQQVPLAALPPPPQHFSSFATTTLQRVETISEDQASAVFVSHTAEPNLYRAIQGHIVDGVAICPAAVFADMAFGATKFLLEQNDITVNSSNLELLDLNMTSPLVVTRQDPEQLIRIAAELEDDESTVFLRFTSSTAASSGEHGTCRVSVSQADSWQSEWSRIRRLISGRADALVKDSTNGGSHRMSKALVYKLFATLVDYSSPYQALDEVFIDETFDDAAARMCLRAVNLGTFTYSPYSVDALVHLAGFLLNGDLKKASDDLHIANHIGKMHIVGELVDDKPMTCYATVREVTSKGASVCDVYVFAETGLLAYCTDIRFQKLTRSIFGALTGKDSLNLSVPAAPKIHLRKPARAESDTSEEDDAFSSAGISDSTTQTSVDTPDLCAALLDIVAEKTGVTVEEMTADTTFASMGVDSQMSISILTDFKRRVGSELPASFFTTFPSVAEVRGELGATLTPATTVTPAPKPKVPSQKPRAPPKSQRPEHAPSARKEPKAAPSSGASLGDALLKIVCTELGLDMEELLPTTKFADIGMDSMISIKILSKFKKDTGTELPAAFFNNNETVGNVKEELDGPSPVAESKPAPAPKKAAAKPAAPPQPAKAAAKKKPMVNGVAAKPQPQATSAPAKKAVPSKPAGGALVVPPKPEPESRTILIQGKASSTDAPLFLVTDGSGAVAAYIYFPALPQGRKIYALESPFLERPLDYTLSIQEMAAVFIKSIRKIQPKGPYLIGGWSAGSIYAYEIAYQLVMAGEAITGLMLLDMRVPHSVEDAQEVTMAFVESTGAFTGVERASNNFLHGLSDKQKAHLTSTVRALIRYDPTPFPEGRRPLLTHVIWATKGLNDSPNPEEHDDRITGPAAMGPCGDGKPMSEMSMEEFEIELKSWFFAKRYDFGTNGWEDFVGDSIVVRKVDGDHFSMVAPPVVKELQPIVLEAVESYSELEN